MSEAWKKTQLGVFRSGRESRRMQERSSIEDCAGKHARPRDSQFQKHQRKAVGVWKGSSASIEEKQNGRQTRSQDSVADCHKSIH